MFQTSGGAAIRNQGGHPFAMNALKNGRKLSEKIWRQEWLFKFLWEKGSAGAMMIFRFCCPFGNQHK